MQMGTFDGLPISRDKEVSIFSLPHSCKTAHVHPLRVFLSSFPEACGGVGLKRECAAIRIKKKGEKFSGTLLR